jgi:type II secretory pathway pseudopilin PulG
MKKIKAYTLIEMLIVMSIMIIVLSIGITSYTAYIETTKYNQDVANLESDITAMQRASMLFKKDADDGWVYGVGIDFNGLIGQDRDGTYRFFKWCSGYQEFSDGGEKTSGKYPNYDSTTETSLGLPNYSGQPTYVESCSEVDISTQPSGALVPLTGYGYPSLNLDRDVIVIPTEGRFLLFESVTGRAFFFNSSGQLIENDTLPIYFDKRRGDSTVIEISRLTGGIDLRPLTQEETSDLKTYIETLDSIEATIIGGDGTIDGEITPGEIDLGYEETQPIEDPTFEY